MSTHDDESDQHYAEPDGAEDGDNDATDKTDDGTDGAAATRTITMGDYEVGNAPDYTVYNNEVGRGDSDFLAEKLAIASRSDAVRERRARRKQKDSTPATGTRVHGEKDALATSRRPGGKTASAASALTDLDDGALSEGRGPSATPTVRPRLRTPSQRLVAKLQRDNQVELNQAAEETAVFAASAEASGHASSGNDGKKRAVVASHTMGPKTAAAAANFRARRNFEVKGGRVSSNSLCSLVSDSGDPGNDGTTNSNVESVRYSAPPEHEIQVEAYAVHDEDSPPAAAIPYDVPSPLHSTLQREGPTEEVIQSLLSVSSKTEEDGGGESSLPPAVTVLAGMGGMGKSVLASSVVYNTRIRRAFSDGVSWLSLGSTKLAPVSYRDRLLTICSHVALNDAQFLAQSGVISRLEGFAFSDQDDNRAARNDCVRLKSMLAPLIVKKKILIVLDDVWHREDLELFFFGRAEGTPCRILVTTRKLDIMEGAQVGVTVPFSPVVELGLPSEAEAFRLLEKVSGKELRRNDPQTEEVIRQCHCLPLAIASVGLLLRGSATFEPSSMVEILDSFSGSGGPMESVALIGTKCTTSADSSTSCYHIFDRTFQVFGEAADVLRICFAAFCACFTTQEGIRASVPREAVQCFFKNLLAGHGGYLTKGQRSSLSTLTNGSPDGENSDDLSLNVIQKLLSVGLLNMDRGGEDSDLVMLAVHHDLQQEYGMKVACNLEETPEKPRPPPRKNSGNSAAVAMARSRASALMVRCYEKRAVKEGRKLLSRKQYDWASVVGDDRRYMLECLVSHMTLANQNKKALRLLTNLSFVSSRMELFGALKFAERLNDEVKMIMRGTPEKKMPPRGWLPIYSAMDKALVVSFINAGSQEERTRLWLEGEEAKNRACIWQPWLFRTEICHSSSPIAILYRRFKAKHCKKMRTLLVEAGHGEHPLAQLWKAHYLLWQRDFNGSLAVHKQIAARKRDMLGDDHALVLSSVAYSMYVNLARGAYEEALLDNEESLRASKAKYGTNDSMEVAFAICFSGECHWRAKRREESVEAFHEARVMYDRLGYTGEIRTLIDNRLAEIEGLHVRG